jgi:hypothetical protein
MNAPLPVIGIQWLATTVNRPLKTDKLTKNRTAVLHSSEYQTRQRRDV